MSIVVRNKSLVPRVIVEKAVEPRSAATRPRPSEAPDAGVRHFEAPDAGEGRAHLMENQFTHGRSRS